MKANRFGWIFGSWLRRGALTSVLALSLIVSVAHAAPAPSSPAPDTEAIARTNELIGKYNAQLDAQAEVMKAISKETPEQIIAALDSAKNEAELQAAANKFWAMKAKEVEESSGGATMLTGQPAVLVGGQTDCILATQITYGASARWEHLVACNNPLPGLHMLARYQATPLEGQGLVTKLDREGRGNYTLSGWRWQVIDYHDFNTTYHYAYTATITNQLLAPLLHSPSVVYMPINKPGLPYPQYYDYNTGRTVWFPSAPFNPARTPNYTVFGRLCQEYYSSHGWTWPISGHQNHHVKPARWAGPDAGSNCARLPNTAHSTFTTWWGVGNLKFETPVSH